MTTDVHLRAVQDSDLPTFFEHQLDPEATRMAAFPSRSHDAFMAHWKKILSTPDVTITRAIVFQGKVAGNVGSWEQAGERNVGYWIGREYWGKGIASAALSLFLKEVKVRPLYAYVVKHNAASIRVLQKCGFVLIRHDKFPGENGAEDGELVLSLGEG